METINEEKIIITQNIELLKWYFDKNKNILKDIEKEKIFNLLSACIYEDPLVFFRIFLFIANTRKTDEQEIVFKTIVHFVGILVPEVVMANIEKFIQFGSKTDVLYYIKVPALTKRIVIWVNHKSNSDEDFKTLYQGTLIKSKINREINYTLENKNYISLLEKILDDSKFNGIQL